MSPRAHLRSSLDRLRDQLATGEPLEASERQHLEEALGQLALLLDDDAEKTSEHDSLAGQLRDAATRFEESHPDLTLAIGAVAEALSRLGI